MAGSFGLIGLIQLIRHRSLFRVSREVIGLGVAYLLAGIVYLAFEMYVVNYRPVLEAGELFPEASFPSSHTVLAFVVFATAAGLLAIFQHRGNIQRLIEGKENRLDFAKISKISRKNK